MEMTLRDLAARLGVDLHGDPDLRVNRVAELTHADSSSVAFLADPKYRPDLKRTSAGAVVLRAADLADCPVAALVSPDPHLTFALAARLLHPPAPVVGGRHPSAVIADGASIDPSAWIGPLAVVEEGVVIGPRVFVGPGSVIGARCQVGEDSRLVARVTLCEGTIVGKRALLHPGCVIGREGFGFARERDRWLRVPQLGRAILGDDVEVGVNSAVDRGSLGDTVIADGVKIDNLIQIGHNVRVGRNTAMAGCVGVAGSATIGANCTIGGSAGVLGHLTIADGVNVSSFSLVTRSLNKPGHYTGFYPLEDNASWEKNAATLKQLSTLRERVRALEKELKETKK